MLLSVRINSLGEARVSRLTNQWTYFDRRVRVAFVEQGIRLEIGFR